MCPERYGLPGQIALAGWSWPQGLRPAEVKAGAAKVMKLAPGEVKVPWGCHVTSVVVARAG